MPSLQIINAMLATLGSKHATASNQVRMETSDSQIMLTISERPWILYRGTVQQSSSSSKMKRKTFR